MRYTRFCGLAVLLCATSLVAAQTKEDKIASRPITYTELGKLVRSQRGKVVIVDVWSLG